MIRIVTGDMLDSGAEALVNPVNCYGVSGAGVAKLMATRFPRAQKEYEWVCKRGRVTAQDNKRGFAPGDILHFFDYDEVSLDAALAGAEENTPKRTSIFYFPTKDHWKDPSKLDYIKKGLKTLRQLIVSTRPASVAIPALGCGLGQLKVEDVLPLVEQELGNMPYQVDIMFYLPHEYTETREAQQS